MAYTIKILGRQAGYSSGTYGWEITAPDGRRYTDGGHASRAHAREAALRRLRRITGYRPKGKSRGPRDHVGAGHCRGRGGQRRG
jgi:hypothetical protein